MTKELKIRSKFSTKRKIAISVTSLLFFVFFMWTGYAFIELKLQQDVAKVNEQKLLNTVLQPSTSRDIKKKDISDLPRNVIGRIKIQKINLNLAIISEFSYKALETSVCRYSGSLSPEEAGNMVIVGHNYQNGAQFGNLYKLNKQDTLVFTDTKGKEYTYKVYDMATIFANDLKAIDNYKGKKAITLVTCSENANRRLIVKFKLCG